MNLEKRVDELERKMGDPADSMLLIVCTFEAPSGSNADVTRPASRDRDTSVTRREVVGYSAVGGAQTWRRAPGETVEDLKARVRGELQKTGRMVGAVCECYADDL